jgi:cell division cycle 20-like protein 1 (cofactor of APC complex)
MITTHGYSLNQVNLWNTLDNWENRSVRKVTTLTGHTYRVLYLAVSPSGESILTGAGDETLRFWNVFNSSHYKKEEQLEFQVDLR